MAHPLDYENYDHLCRLRHALRGGKHATLKSLFPDIVRMNTRHMHQTGLSFAEKDRYDSYDDFLKRCWYLHHLIGDLWAKYRPTILSEDWTI